MKINILGSNGSIGKGLRSLNQEKFTFFSRLSSDKYFSISNPKEKSEYSKLNSNDVVLFLAALSKPNYIENNKVETINLNFINTSLILDTLLEKNVKILFASTDQVYGSNIDLACEDDQTNPKNFYAYSKLLIEEKYKTNQNFKVLRFSQCVNGFDSFSLYSKDCITNNRKVELFKNHHRNLFSTDLLEEFLTRIKNNIIQFENIPKILNFGGSNVIKKSEFSSYLTNCQVDYKPESKTHIPYISINTTLLEKLLQQKYKFNFTNWKNNIHE